MDTSSRPLRWMYATTTLPTEAPPRLLNGTDCARPCGMKSKPSSGDCAAAPSTEPASRTSERAKVVLNICTNPLSLKTRRRHQRAGALERFEPRLGGAAAAFRESAFRGPRRADGERVAVPASKKIALVHRHLAARRVGDEDEVAHVAHGQHVMLRRLFEVDEHGHAALLDHVEQ